MPTKVHLVNVMVCPVVVCGCESWTIRKAEHWSTDAFKHWCFQTRKTFVLGCKIKSVNPKGDQSWISLEELMLKLKLQYFGHVMWRADSFERTLMLGKIEGRRTRGWQRIRWLDWHYCLDGQEFEQALGVGDGPGNRACCSPWVRKAVDTTEWLNWTELKHFLGFQTFKEGKCLYSEYVPQEKFPPHLSSFYAAFEECLVSH